MVSATGKRANGHLVFAVGAVSIATFGVTAFVTLERNSRTIALAEGLAAGDELVVYNGETYRIECTGAGTGLANARRIAATNELLSVRPVRAALCAPAPRLDN
jgi:hypothetical protein